MGYTIFHNEISQTPQTAIGRTFTQTVDFTCLTPATRARLSMGAAAASKEASELATPHVNVYWVVANGGILMPVRSSPMMTVRAVGEC